MTTRYKISPASDEALLQHKDFEDWSPDVRKSFDALLDVDPTRKAAVVTTMRNDGVSILQWVAHYRALGFDGIFVYSNDNADGSDEILRLLAATGVITFIENQGSGGFSPQRKAFEHSIRLLPELRVFEWVFYADSDEFLDLPRHNQDVQQMLAEVDARFPAVRPSAICYHWKWFVSAYDLEFKPGLLLARFQHGNPHQSFKSIVRLRDVVSMCRLHFPDLRRPNFFVDANMQPIRHSIDVEDMWSHGDDPICGDGGYVRHYWCKSFEEFVVKKLRGDSLSMDGNPYKRDYKLFFEWNGACTDENRDSPPDDFLQRVEREIGVLEKTSGVAELDARIQAGFLDLLRPLGGRTGVADIYSEYMDRLGISRLGSARSIIPADARHGRGPNAATPRGSEVVPDHGGAHYLSVMSNLHEALEPQRYFEIGVAQGATLELARCESLAVDPTYAITRDVFGQKPACHLYGDTSDAFFAKRSPLEIMGGPIDLAFLDGTHYYEVLLRDFINTERWCQRASVIVMHDCIPTDAYVARREPGETAGETESAHKGWWAGDVWKTLLILQKYRPDLRMYCLDAPPTGLVIVTNLDPRSRVLANKYEEAVTDIAGHSFINYGIAKLQADIGLRSTASIWESGHGPKRLRQEFWL